MCDPEHGSDTEAVVEWIVINRERGVTNRSELNPRLAAD